MRVSEAAARPDVTVKSKFALPFEDPRPTIAELLQRRGMHTMAVVDTALLAPELGFGTGFDKYHNIAVPHDKQDDGVTAKLAIEHLYARPKDKRFFLWVHFLGPHAPSRRHAGVERYGDSTSDRYDHEIAYMDSQLGRLLEEIDRLPDPVVVMLTSDHGEHFHPAGVSRGHGKHANESDVRIPMLLKAPSVRPGSSDALVSLVDVVPTLLALTETPAPNDLNGVDLSAVVARGWRLEDRILFADSFVYSNRGAARFRFDLSAVIGWTHKLFQERFTRRKQLITRPGDEYATRGSAEEIRLTQALKQYLVATGGTPVAHP
jgi:hypothetical protein